MTVVSGKRIRTSFLVEAANQKNGICCYKPYRNFSRLSFDIKNEGDTAKSGSLIRNKEEWSWIETLASTEINTFSIY